MAFLPPAPVPLSRAPRPRSPKHAPPRPRPRVCVRSAAAEPPPPPPPPSPPPSAAPIPASLPAACEAAVSAAQAALAAGHTRLFVEVDTSSGDATYTMLKRSLPIARMLHPLLPDAVVVLPDAGAAALARRDWPSARVVGLEQVEPPDLRHGAFVVVPRASDVDRLVPVLEAAPAPVVLVNPDLVDMGVTGLSLNARRLREGVLDAFETAYHLRVFPWGVLLRAFPGPWGVWVDEPDSQVGFRLVAEMAERPAGDAIDDVLRAEFGGAGEGVFAKLKRFLGVYMKG